MRPGNAVDHRGQTAAHPGSPGVSGVPQAATDAAPPEDRDEQVVVVEVGPRDGLQNESAAVPTGIKIAFVDALSAAGFPVVETTSFVSPRAVPQLADAAAVMTGITRRPGTRYLVLVPNLQGVERAIAAGVDSIAVFTAASEQFAAANVGTTIDGTFERFAPVAAMAREMGLWMRGYVSVAFGCPYAGPVRIEDVVSVTERLQVLGCDEICLADTIGIANPREVRDVTSAVTASLDPDRLALHFHDTTGLALANVEAGLEAGVRIFDAAAGGLGGCPFAPGAPGNLSSERLLHRLGSLGMRTGVDVRAVATAVDTLRPYVARLGATAT
jgi:hydroxymethylglutaryl-CoA lyase